MTNKIPWLRVTLEAVTIVVSILLAFAVQAWWEGAQERERERAYLVALRGEFEQVQADLSSRERRRASAFHAHAALLDQIQGEERAPADSLFYWASGTSMQFVLDLPHVVLDDVVSVGGVRLIRSDSLRLALGRYVTELERTRFLDDLAWATWEQRIQPFLEGRIPRVDRIRQGRAGSGLQVPFGASNHSADWDAVFDEPAFEDMIAERWLRLRQSSRQFATLSRLVGQLIGLIDSELEESR